MRSRFCRALGSSRRLRSSGQTRVAIELLEARQLLAATDVVISEVMYHPGTLNDGGEYIELLNRGHVPVDLSGWRLDDAIDYRFPQGTTLAAGQYLVVYGDPGAKSFYGLNNSNSIGPFAQQLDNAGERVMLRAADGSQIDVVAYDDNEPWPLESDGSGASLEVIDPTHDNALASNWAPGQLYTPGKPNRPAVGDVSGAVVISEIMYRPEMRRYTQPIDPIANQSRWQDGDDPAGEFIELLNRGPSTVDLSAWRIADADDVLFQFPAGTSLASGQYLVVAANSQAIKDRYGIANVIGNFTAGRELSNNGEPLTLADSTGKIVDFVRYSDDSPWPLAPDQLGTSLELIDPQSDNRDAASWRASQVPRPKEPSRPTVGTDFFITRGTPGTANSVADTGLPPFVARGEIQHLPNRPRSRDVVTVVTRVQASVPITQVKLLYEVFVAPYQTAAASAELVMRDDGQGGDVIASDGQFTAQLPAMASQTLVRYRVQAADASARSATYPDSIEPNPNIAYFVYDGEEDTNLNAYFLIVPTATQRALDANIWTADFHDATLVIDGIVHDHVGIHYRGRGWRVHPKKSYRVAFNKGEYYRDMSRLDLAMHFPTMQNVVHNMFAAVGVKPLGSEPVRLYRNGSLYGLMLAQESPNESWLEANGMDGDGEIFKASAAPSYSSSGFSGNLIADMDYYADHSVYPQLYERKGDSLGSYEAIIQLTNVIANTPNEQLYETLQETVELDEWLYSWAVNVAGANGDIIGTNYTLVKPAEEGARWQSKPFDFSHFFGCQMLDFTDVICNPYTQDPYRYFNHFHYRVMNHEQLKNRFLNILKDVLESQLTSTRVNRMIDQAFHDYEVDRLDEVALAIPGPPTHYVVYGSDQQEMKDYFARRRQWLLDTWIPGQGITPLANQHPTIRLESPEFRPDGTTVRWTHEDAEGDASRVDLYWSDGQWLNFQPIPGAQGLDAATGSFHWPTPPGTLNADIFIQAVIRDSVSDLVGRDTSTKPGPPDPPSLDVAPGEVTTVILVNPNPGGTIYYTLNGGDPKARDNEPAADAIVYDAAIRLTDNARLQARIRSVNEAGNGHVWSDLVDEFVVVRIPSLVVTEIMYNPAGGSDYEFIEFFNRGDRPVSLAGIVADGRGEIFDFSQSNLVALQPGEYMVLVNDLAGFLERYDTDQNKIAGEFSQNLSNTGQRIDLTLAALPEPFLSVLYEDTWYPTTDGSGASMVLIDPHSDRNTWNNAGAWRASLRTNGSPGEADIEDPDLNNDQTVNVQDIDALCQYIAADDLRFDFSQDGVMNSNDLMFVITNVLGTTAGDANLDGRFNSADLVLAFQAGRYENATAGDSGWATGDWNCDGEFSSSDLVVAFQMGGYDALAAEDYRVVRLADANRLTSFRHDHGL